MSLARKTTKGLFWVSFSMVLIKIINFIINVILARLLEPEHFGLVAIALIVVNFFDLWKEMGIGTALIYKKNDVDRAANTAFFLFPAAGVVLYVISYLIAPIAADFFNEPQVEAIIKLLALTVVIMSFGSLPNTLLNKNLEFRKKIIPQTLPKIGYAIVAIGLALNGFGVWSIVIGQIILTVMFVFIVWLVVDWRPSYKFDRNIAFELISYGKQVVAADTLVFLISIVDITFIGRFLGAEDVGFYSIALGIALLLTSQVSVVIANVMFPIYSIIQDDRATLKKAYLRTIKYVSLVSFPATFGLFMIAWDSITVIYGTKWLPAVAALQVLCFYGLNRALLGTTEQLYLAAGKPKIRTKLNLLQLILMAALMYPLTMRYGILGTSIAAMLPATLIVFLTFREAGKIIEENFTYIAKSFVPGITGSMVMVVAIYAWNYVSASFNPVLRLAVSVILGSSLYVAFLWLTRKELFYEVRELLMKRQE